MKGTLTDEGSVAVSLAHLERMAKEKMPWFVAVFVLGATAPHRPTTAYMVHVDEPLITRVTKRLFESSLSGTPTHAQTMDVTWRESDRVDLAGDAILTRIRTVVGDTSTYPEAKQRSLDLAAAELQKLSGTMSFYYRSKHAMYEALANLAIGEIDRIPLRSLSARGDILKKISKSGSVRVGRATLEVKPFTIGESTIELQGSGGTTRLRCTTRPAHAVFSLLPDKYNKVRFDSRFFKLVACPGASDVAWNVKLFNLHGKATLAELDVAARAVAILSGDDVNVTIRTPHGKEARYRANEKFEHDQDSKGFMLVVTNACAVAQAFGMALDSVDVDVAKLLTQWRRLTLVRSVVDETYRTEHIGIWLEGKPEQHEATFVVCPGIDLGETVLVASGALSGPITATPEDGGYRVSIVSPKLRPFERARYRSDDWDEAMVSKLMERAAAQLDKEGAPLIITADPPMTVRPAAQSA